MNNTITTIESLHFVWNMNKLVSVSLDAFDVSIFSYTCGLKRFSTFGRISEEKGVMKRVSNELQSAPIESE